MRYQLLFAGLALLVTLGGLLQPEFRTVSLQLIGVLLLAALVIARMGRKTQERDRATQAIQEETLLFLTTVVKPKVEQIASSDNPAEAAKSLEGEISRFITRVPTA